MLSKPSIIAAGLCLSLFPLSVQAQGGVSNIQCNHLTESGSVSFDEKSLEVDWFAVAGHTNPHEATQGCLIDTTGVSQAELERLATDEAALAKFIESRNGGGTLTGLRETSGTHDQSDPLRLQDTYENNPTLFFSVLGFLILAALGAILFAAFRVLRLIAERRSGRFICKIQCELLVEDLTITGRMIRVGPQSCQFVPDKAEASDRVAGILLRSDIPDFDLKIDKATVPVVPDVPGSRFTSIFFVKELEKEVLQGWLELSETTARRENTPANIKASKQRDAQKSLRLSRMKTQTI